MFRLSFVAGIYVKTLICGITISGISNYLKGNGIDLPVVSGILLSNILGISFCTSDKTMFIILFLNCGDVTYLYPKYPPPITEVTITNETILKI